MTINNLIKINGTEITEHNRTFSDNAVLSNVDVELASGNTRRYYKPPRRSFSFAWTYLPDKSTKTADLRVGRDFLYTLVTSGSLVTLSIQQDRKDEWKNYTCYITSYNESMLKNVLQSQCRYFDVNLVLEEI